MNDSIGLILEHVMFIWAPPLNTHLDLEEVRLRRGYKWNNFLIAPPKPQFPLHFIYLMIKSWYKHKAKTTFTTMILKTKKETQKEKPWHDGQQLVW